MLEAHIYQGLCPDDTTGAASRDSECPACQMLEDAARYRQFFVSGLPITFEGVEYRTKADLDAAMDAARATHGKEGA